MTLIVGCANAREGVEGRFLCGSRDPARAATTAIRPAAPRNRARPFHGRR